MNITQRDENGIAVFVLEGRIDSEGAVVLDKALHSAVNAKQHKIVLDMTQVAYINSAALRTLADVVTLNRAEGGDLKLAAVQPKVKRVFQIIGFDRFSTIYDTLKDAMNDF